MTSDHVGIERDMVFRFRFGVVELGKVTRTSGKEITKLF
jgi:hypothetical protein